MNADDKQWADDLRRQLREMTVGGFALVALLLSIALAIVLANT